MSKGKATRESILSNAFVLASENGLDSLTIGELAKYCGMSKSGLFAHFNSKENLQISVLEYANQVFTQRVITPARELGTESAEKKIRFLLESWLGWNHSFQGSCMFLDAWKECNSETPLIQDALKRTITSWIDYLSIQIEKGAENGEFQSNLDARQAAFELYGMYLSAHLFYSAYGEGVSSKHFWSGVNRLLGSWKN